MSVSQPSVEYRFYQDRIGAPTRMKWVVRGDPNYPGNYTVGGKSIVETYNQSAHWRSGDELDRMGQINEAYQRNEARRLTYLIEDTREKFRDHASEKVAAMWDAVFAQYGEGD